MPYWAMHLENHAVHVPVVVPAQGHDAVQDEREQEQGHDADLALFHARVQGKALPCHMTKTMAVPIHRMSKPLRNLPC